MTGMDPMSAQDAMFLHVEDDVTPMHIGGVSIFEGPPPPFAEVRDMVARKLHHTPRYRQKVRLMPLRLAEPVWVDDPYFELDYHLRHTAVPAPGDDDQLRAMAARVSPSTSTARARCGSSGWSRGCAAAAGRCSPRSTTAWSTGWPRPTSCP